MDKGQNERGRLDQTETPGIPPQVQPRLLTPAYKLPRFPPQQSIPPLPPENDRGKKKKKKKKKKKRGEK
jgi:hypothetical protein